MSGNFFVESKTRTYVPRAGRDGVAHGGMAGRGGDGQDGVPTGLFAQETTDPLPSRQLETTLLGVPLEARTKEIRLRAVWGEPLFVDPLWRGPHKVIQGTLF